MLELAWMPRKKQDGITNGRDPWSLSLRWMWSLLDMAKDLRITRGAISSKENHIWWEAMGTMGCLVVG